MPLARMLMTNRMAPRSYVGIEYNKMEMPQMFDNTTFQPHLIDNVDFTQTDIMEDSFNVSVCLEVLEHVEPSKAIAILDKLADVVVQGGTCYFSTPCYDEKVGAAKNHVNEMTYEAFGALLEAKGFQIVDHYGTFASQKDYKHELDGNTKYLYSKLSEYYDTNYLATIFAPLYPSMARNVLWKCINTQSKDFNKRFPPVRELEGTLGSSDKADHIRYA